ncbi:hypothetical protein PHYBLDRAFT_166015 [Phycomyces blakesleeanus NRRL 1555(-)]|uniref:Uncharacterized protein n=1 Tax=Phycomyces blakesleeanus (strain ATCC 8743b / DSM 1359 / FGSC 10004 / NBRC 33097 / NRRL 1555) TaxID=763407 RepID=A0A167NJ04_PHYB8|nr:hypothetical protein PHYBLDRAFT_166015 [Phycomyces blakesleeanus NRRL 1555(-)]OAD76039.1 hypothetical protein PHYBLDRAFT_166015 [Phycomyces blakesleeanus NRRL 1555(-)]|eukprot:XP_018294079.1 hypothetical protein PHYBLDRAFT_166015 [Phycomyces blakesleeanus NRRL 1555(-)]
MLSVEQLMDIEKYIAINSYPLFQTMPCDSSILDFLSIGISSSVDVLLIYPSKVQGVVMFSRKPFGVVFPHAHLSQTVGVEASFSFRALASPRNLVDTQQILYRGILSSPSEQFFNHVTRNMAGPLEPGLREDLRQIFNPVW